MSSVKSIAIIRSGYSPFGGVEGHALSLIKGLLQRNIEVTLLTLPGQNWPLAHDHLKIVPMGISRGTRLMKVWGFNRMVNKYLCAEPHPVILSLDNVTTFTHLHAGGGTHKTFLKIRSQNENVFSNLFRLISPFHRYLLYLEKKGFENDKLLKVRCNSTMVFKDIQKDYHLPVHKLCIIPPGGVRWREMQEVFDAREQIAADLRKANHIDVNWKSLLFLGSGFERKGLGIAISGLSFMHDDYHLIVVGKDRINPYIRISEKYGVAHRVHFLGPQKDGWRFAALCRALLLPSHYDPFGKVAAEGNAMGIPVLVSDKTGYADHVVHGQNGVILQTPMELINIKKAFCDLMKLIESPQWTPQQLRDHARQCDDEVVLERLLREFF